ncbi:MAG: glycosyltransferase family 4 protein [Mojavia pulchra JT2-VF2]|jgi:glycosyltransferase involved in cell wall biosynthesis|uniref:Glycosyltransferase family 4 protein n=1 Tax=Mojavia pulchra JT2-VF2 TaxID=287848 RepID=A0A951UEZ3_9NOST|nr:glycosyltransferase family 4 protein [Mojavia pulchra JT2-VF2]
MILKIIMVGSSLEQNGGIASFEKLILKHAPTDIEIQHITSHDEGSIAHRLIIFVKALVKFLWRLIFEQTDIIYLQISEGGNLLRKSIFALIAFIFRKPVLLHAHGAEFHLTYSRLPEWAKQLLSGIFRRCSGLIVLSKTWKDYYVLNLDLNPQRVFVLPNPAELPVEIPQRMNANQVTLLFCGRVGQRKGTFDLIEAFANLPAEQKNCAKLIIAGDGDIEQGRKLIEKLNLTEHITFAGWVNSEQRDKLLAKADVFLLPSYNEGLPMAILEAMSWGLPVITTPVGGIPELVVHNENGLLVKPGDIQQLSAAILSLITNEELRLILGKTARERVMPYDIKNYLNSLFNVYNSVLTQAKKHSLYESKA